MKFSQSLLFCAIVLLSSFAFQSESSAQTIKDPTKWTVKATRRFGNKFDIFFTVKIAKGWHVYALDPGGDGSLIPTTFEFAPNEAATITAPIIAKTEPEGVEADGVDGKFFYYSNEATFAQEVDIIGNKPVTISGSYEYQSCNDKMCLPPKKIDFTVTITP